MRTTLTERRRSNRKEARQSRIATAEAELRIALVDKHFRRNTEHPEWDAYDLGSTRVCFFSDDERVEVYSFDGECLDYKVDLSLGMPIGLVIGIISQILRYAGK